MRTKLTITDRLYKAVSKPDAQAPQPIDRIVCAKNDEPRLIAVMDACGRASRLVCDGSPSLGLTSAVRLRVSVEGPFATRVSPIGYVRDNDGVKVSDIVLSGKSHEYEGGEFALAACEIELPEGVAAGDYRLCVKLYESRGLNDEILADEKILTLSVKDCLLPATDTYGFYADFWQHNSNIARTFGVALWSDAHFALIGKVLQKLKKLGQKSVTVIASDCPWRGWGCYLMRDTPANLFEYNIVQVSRDKSGAFRYDFRALDRLLAFYESFGIHGDITLYGLLGIWRMPYFDTAQVDYPEAVKINYIDETDGRRKYISERGDISDYIRALFAHLKTVGVWDRVRVGADEPSQLEPFFQNLKLLQEIEPSLKLKIAMDRPEIIDALGTLCQDVCLSFPCTLQAFEKKDNLPIGGRKLWYVCNVPDRPNSLLDNSLAETAALGALNLAFGFDGLLRWAFTCWSVAPTQDVRYNISGLPAGDICLVYPSSDGGIYESQRYDALRFGILLYELLARVKTRDERKFSEFFARIVGKREEFLPIRQELGISTAEQDYIELYESLLDYAQSAGGVL